jgi:hypothetical protein
LRGPAIDKIKKGDEVVRIAFRHTSLQSGSVDTMVGRLIVEAKHGASASDPAKLKQLQERVVRQLKRFHASGLADKVRYIVPDEATKNLIKDHLAKKLEHDADKSTLEAFFEFDIIPSHWKKEEILQ